MICHARPHEWAKRSRQCDSVKSRNGKKRNQKSGEKFPRGDDVHEAVVFDVGVFLGGGEDEGVVGFEEIHRRAQAALFAFAVLVRQFVADLHELRGLAVAHDHEVALSAGFVEIIQLRAHLRAGAPQFPVDHVFEGASAAPGGDGGDGAGEGGVDGIHFSRAYGLHFRRPTETRQKSREIGVFQKREILQQGCHGLHADDLAQFAGGDGVAGVGEQIDGEAFQGARVADVVAHDYVAVQDVVKQGREDVGVSGFQELGQAAVGQILSERVRAGGEVFE